MAIRVRQLAIGCLFIFTLSALNADHAVALTLDWVKQLTLRVRTCWQPPSGIGANDAIEARVMISLNPDGTLKGTPELVDVTQHDLSRAYVESIFAAIKRCQPYAFLPAGEYKDGWDRLDMTFSTDAALLAPSRLKHGPRTFNPEQLQKVLRERAKGDSKN